MCFMFLPKFSQFSPASPQLSISIYINVTYYMSHVENQIFFLINFMMIEPLTSFSAKTFKIQLAPDIRAFLWWITTVQCPFLGSFLT